MYEKLWGYFGCPLGGYSHGITLLQTVSTFLCNHVLQFLEHSLNVALDDHALIMYLSLLVRILKQLDSFDHIHM